MSPTITTSSEANGNVSTATARAAASAAANAEEAGPQPVTIHGARLYVLPNPSGRNANFSYAEMLEAFGRLR